MVEQPHYSTPYGYLQVSAERKTGGLAGRPSECECVLPSLLGRAARGFRLAPFGFKQALCLAMPAQHFPFQPPRFSRPSIGPFESSIAPDDTRELGNIEFDAWRTPQKLIDEILVILPSELIPTRLVGGRKEVLAFAVPAIVELREADLFLRKRGVLSFSHPCSPRPLRRVWRARRRRWRASRCAIDCADSAGS